VGTATTGTVKSGGTAATARCNCRSISLPASSCHWWLRNGCHLAVIHGARESEIDAIHNEIPNVSTDLLIIVIRKHFALTGPTEVVKSRRRRTYWAPHMRSGHAACLCLAALTCGDAGYSWGMAVLHRGSVAPLVRGLDPKPSHTNGWFQEPKSYRPYCTATLRGNRQGAGRTIGGVCIRAETV
jgi:hypothetical protein